MRNGPYIRLHSFQQGAVRSRMEEEIPRIVIDNCSYEIQAGFGGDDSFRSIFPTLIGTSKTIRSDSYIGCEAQERRSLLDLSYPIQDGIINNWEDMEKIWNYVFQRELRVANPNEYGILITENVFNPQNNRKKMCEILFESMNAPSCAIPAQPILGLIASGRTTGVVLDGGYHSFRSTPIKELSVFASKAFKVEIGGSHLNNYLIQLLNQRGFTFTPGDEGFIEKMKRSFCYLAPFLKENEKEKEFVTEKLFELPDGQMIPLQEERIQCPEILFQPSLFSNIPGPNVIDIVYQSIHSFEDYYTRKDLNRNIVMTGGSTMFPGFQSRFQEEYVARLLPGQIAMMVCPPERRLSNWIGGSICCVYSGFSEKWMSREEYQEHGPSYIETKTSYVREEISAIGEEG